MIVDSMDIVPIKSRDFVIRQGEEGDYFYVVYSGELSIMVDGKHVGTIGVGAGFGELALLHNTPRAASIKAESNASLFSLDRKTFRYIIAQSECYRTDDILTSLKRVKVLQQLTDDQFQRVSDVVQLVKYQAGIDLSLSHSLMNSFTRSLNKGMLYSEKAQKATFSI